MLDRFSQLAEQAATSVLSPKILAASLAEMNGAMAFS